MAEDRDQIQVLDEYLFTIIPGDVAGGKSAAGSKENLRSLSHPPCRSAQVSPLQLLSVDGSPHLLPDRPEPSVTSMMFRGACRPEGFQPGHSLPEPGDPHVCLQYLFSRAPFLQRKVQHDETENYGTIPGSPAGMPRSEGVYCVPVDEFRILFLRYGTSCQNMPESTPMSH